jgi:hypothetical protein
LKSQTALQHWALNVQLPPLVTHGMQVPLMQLLLQQSAFLEQADPAPTHSHSYSENAIAKQLPLQQSPALLQSAPLSSQPQVPTVLQKLLQQSAPLPHGAPRPPQPQVPTPLQKLLQQSVLPVQPLGSPSLSQPQMPTPLQKLLQQSPLVAQLAPSAVH